ncbi:MAG: glycosyltransferase family 39 protein [Candidatus Tantalella remota]|nr:glycosyltransferase family 39 protein [Candidatus Tantalella remota]
MRSVYFVIILLVTSLVIFFFGLGNLALTDPDESFYAESAKEMLEAGDWVTPRIFDEPQFEKPVFYYWLVMISYSAFGINEFAARLPSVIFSIAGVLGVFFLGRLLFGRIMGFFSGIMLMSSVLYIALARACVTDMVLTVFILYCFLFLLMGWTTGKKAHYYISAAMAALAVMTKGPIGLFIPGMTVILYVSISRQWDLFKKIPWLGCAFVFFLVAMPWYIVATKIHGAGFINEFFGFRNITRFLEPEHRIGDSPFFYIPIVLGGFFPWSVFLPSGAWLMYKDKTNDAKLPAYRLFLLVWFLTVFVFFSVSRTKLVTYILPLFPVMALVAGRLWERFAFKERKNEQITRHVSIAFYILVGTGILSTAVVYFVFANRYPQILLGIIQAGVVFTGGLLFSLILFVKKKRDLSVLCVVLTILMMMGPVVRHIFPIVEKYESSKTLSLRVNALAAPDEPIGGEDDHRGGIAFYTGRTDIVDIHPYHSLVEFFRRKDRVWGIIQKKHYTQLKGQLGDVIYGPAAESGKYVLISNQPILEEGNSK